MHGVRTGAPAAVKPAMRYLAQSDHTHEAKSGPQGRGESGKPFAAYLERQIASKGAAAASGPASAVEVRKPGSTEWASPHSPKGQAAMTPTCPPGERGSPQPVLP